jgi:hypothetical protein
MMSVLSLFMFTYAMWGQGVQKLAAERRQRDERASQGIPAVITARISITVLATDVSK